MRRVLGVAGKCLGLPSVPKMQRNVVLFAAMRCQTSSTNSSVPPPPTPAPSDSSSYTAVPNKSGIMNVSNSSLTKTMQSDVPTLLLIFTSRNEEHLQFCDLFVRQTAKLNKEHADKATLFNGQGPEQGILLKLALSDVSKDVSIAQRLKIDLQVDTLPQVFFVRSGSTHDRMTGIVAESSVIEACSAFLEYCAEEAKGDGKSLKKYDDTEENPMTLLVAANTAMKEKKMARAKPLYEKSLDMALKHVVPIKTRLGFDRKTPTEAMMKQLRKQAVYNAAPQALAGLMMCEMMQDQRAKAVEIVARIRNDYPYATTDLREVAGAIAKVEILVISGLPVVEGYHLKLHTLENPAEEGAAFYHRQLQIAADYYLNQRIYSGAMDLLLRLIRSEVKLLPELKAAKIVPEDTVLKGMNCTPARKVLKLIFEALGETMDLVVDYRKKAQAIV